MEPYISLFIIIAALPFSRGDVPTNVGKRGFKAEWGDLKRRTEGFNM